MTDLRSTTEEETQIAHEQGPPIVDHIMMFPPQIGLTILVYVMTLTILSLTPKPGKSRVEAFDTWCAAVRKSIADNEGILSEPEAMH